MKSKGSKGEQLLNPVTYYLSTANGGGVPPSDLSPIASFKVTFGGPYTASGQDFESDATFSSGAGLIVVKADQAMTVKNDYPSCIGFKGETNETSNVAYGELPAIPSTTLSQAFRIG